MVRLAPHLDIMALLMCFKTLWKLTTISKSSVAYRYLKYNILIAFDLFKIWICWVSLNFGKISDLLRNECTEVLFKNGTKFKVSKLGGRTHTLTHTHSHRLNCVIHLLQSCLLICPTMILHFPFYSFSIALFF